MVRNVLYGPSDKFKDGIFEITQYTLINVVTLNGVSFKCRCFAVVTYPCTWSSVDVRI